MGLKNQMTMSGGGSGFYGPQSLGFFTPQNNEGLGLPGGQAVFNLPRTGNVPGTSVNFPSGQVGGGGQMNLSITRTASSDPVQNIINDISNPLSGANINLTPSQAPKQQQSGGFTAAATPPSNPFANDQWAPIGARGNTPGTIGTPGFANWLQGGAAQQAPFGLRNRMIQGAQGSALAPYAFL